MRPCCRRAASWANGVVSTAVPELAYGLGGDAFDGSLTETTLHVVILDATGHDLASGLTTATAAPEPDRGSW